MPKSKVQIIIVHDQYGGLTELLLLEPPDLYEQDLCPVARVVVFWTEQAEEIYQFIFTTSIIRRWEETEESIFGAILSHIKKYRQDPGKI